MRTSSMSEDDKLFQSRMLDAAIRISLLALLVLWCFNIIKPFIMPILWGAIMAVAIYPLFVKAQVRLGGREKLTATLITLVALAILIIPAVMLSESLISGTQNISEEYQAGTLTVPPPSEKVKDWPLIGEELHSAWTLASSNLEAAFVKFKPQVEAFGKWFLSSAAGIGAGVLMFVISIIIAGVFLVFARSGSQALEIVIGRVIGEKEGREFVDMSGATIRSVAQGVLGVALIQTILGGVGMLAIGVPYAGVWALLILFMAVQGNAVWQHLL